MAELAAGLDPKTREIATALAANPTDIIHGELKGYLEDFIRLTMGTPKNWTPPVGSPLIVMQDLTAQTGEYVYTDEWGLQYIYFNGVQVSQATYADLYAFVGPNAFGTDTGGNFYLGDCRGRSLFFCGTNAAADLGDNDGQSEANRQAAHLHTSTGLTVTGAPGLGSLAINAAGPSHSHDVTTSNELVAAGAINVADHATYTTSGPSATTTAVTGAPAIGSLDVGGTVGSGMTGDGPAHLYIGSLLVRF